MNTLSGKQVVLGITGGIAAYKGAELVRMLRNHGASVRVVMTRGALEFITPLTLQALSGHPVSTDIMASETGNGMGHIELARWADVLLVAPATADFMSRAVQGRADDMLGAVWLACEAKRAIAPAMNHTMWKDEATRANLETLRERKVEIYGPARGEQACGEHGPGRMLEPADIVHELGELFSTGSLAGRQVLITAGPTREAIDPVRFISNYSSGRMGYAIAQAAVEAGAGVVLVSGPVQMPTPARVQRVDVVSAREMYDAVMQHVADCDIFIGVAAVADYRPQAVADSKLKKTAAHMTLELERNPDILAAVAGLAQAPFTVGFAAETHDMEANARSKRQTKSVDMIAANTVGSGRGFDAADNALHVFWEGGDLALPLATKARLARQLIELVAKRFSYTHNKVLPFDAKDPA